MIDAIVVVIFRQHQPHPRQDVGLYQVGHLQTTDNFFSLLTTHC
jgi:hypothetical protein